MAGTTITHIATCRKCGGRDIRIEYTKSGARRYCIVCVACGYVTPDEEHLADCDRHMDWVQQPARQQVSA